MGTTTIMRTTTLRLLRTSAMVVASVAMAAALLVSPALADDDLMAPGDSGAGSGLQDSPGQQAPTVNDPNTGPASDPEPEPEPGPDSVPDPGEGDEIEEPKPEPAESKPAVEPASDEPPGPVGHTGAAVYETVRGLDDSVPTAVRALTDDDSVDVTGFRSDQHDAFIALLTINSADAPSEYRFEAAIPKNHSAELQPDGSIKISDAAGAETGFIAAPWAIDSTGAMLATSYSIDGTTLVQTVDHIGATYPVVADPSWWETAAGWAGTAAAAAGVAICLATACTAAAVAVTVVGAGAAAAFVAGQMIPDSSTGGGKRSTNKCNMRNRRGC